MGTALAVKPLLHVAQGRILPLEKVRTTARAAQRLVELAAQAAGEGPVDVAVQHLAAAARAEEVAARLRERLDVARLLVSEVGAVIGAHVGTGLVGVVVVPRTGATPAPPGSVVVELSTSSAVVHRFVIACRGASTPT